MSNLLTHAKRELKLLAKQQKDRGKEDDLMDKCVLELVQTFAKQKHSGFSASICIGRLIPLLTYRCLTPLLGTEGEWDYKFALKTDSGTVLNARCGRIYKNADGKAYRTDGRVFRLRGTDSEYTNKLSCTKVEFPYNTSEMPQYVVINKECYDWMEDDPEKNICRAKVDASYDCSHCVNCCANEPTAFRG